MKRLLLTSTLVLFSILATNAQPPSDGFCDTNSGPDDPDCIPNSVPLDGGVAFLLGACALYGMKKIKES